MSVIAAESTGLFVGPVDAPLQVVRVSVAGATAPTPLHIAGPGLVTAGLTMAPVGDATVEIPVAVSAREPGRQRAATVIAGADSSGFTFVDAEPGATMFMISHFHYDPVWWNTQAAYTSLWTEDPPGKARQTNGFELVHAHLDMARRDPDYKFVLAEVDYLKPYWDTHPEDRADLRRLITAGRIEIMGGTYNEPNTNLTGPETAIRNLVHGMGFQRGVLGAEPATAWQLDVFGHDPQFPGMAADAGLTSSSWARGPFHQWGPMAGDGDPKRMQFASEFEWIAPSGLGLLTHYMPAHYSAGWWMDSAASLAEAEDATHQLFERLQTVTSTRNVLLPVGTDYTPPNKWVTEIHRDWNARYTWPKFVCALPREFFAAVRAELDERGVAASPQTRDMNPIYTGKDVSFIDTKQANRAAEAAVLDGERFATFAALLSGSTYPEPAFAKAWVQLAYGAHHDAITGSESDQVYLDLLTGWRDAWELGRAARDNSLAVLSAAVDGDIVVWNPLVHNRTDIVTLVLGESSPVRILDPSGNEVPTVVADDGSSITFLARDVPSLGWRAYRLAAGTSTGWSAIDGAAIANEHYALRADPGRGGAVVSLIRAGCELIADGRVGNELAVYEEYPAHPSAGEGPWHLLPKGPVVVSSDGPAQVQAYRCALGERLVVRGQIGDVLSYTQTVTLWAGIGRIDCRTVIDEFSGADRLLRLRWPCPVPGGLPVSEVGDAVVGRGFGLIHDPVDPSVSVDTAVHPWTLENPAYTWFGVSSAVRITFGDSLFRAVSVAEVVAPTEAESGPLARDLMVALVRAGVTATCSVADKPRYGHLEVDSNLPDTRIALGGPAQNAFTAAVLADADPAYADEVHRQLRESGTARVWVPATGPLAGHWRPGADLRAVRALPVLVIAGRDQAALVTEITSVTEDLDDAEIAVEQATPVDAEAAEARTVALLNRGVPSFAVDTDRTLHTSLMRSCTGWPSGVWPTHQRRSAPDGSHFQQQHWTHAFDYALIADDGDWRQARIPARSAEFSRPLVALTASGSGDLPAVGSLLYLDGAGAVALEALKVTGNPTAAASARTIDPDAVTLRMVESHGTSTRVGVSSDVATISVLAKANLLEQSQRDIGAIELHGYEIATILARLDVPTPAAGTATVLAPDTEAAQPLFARYWLHNRGPAPLGGLPAVAHLQPHRREAAAGEAVTLRLTAASDCTDAALTGTVRMRCPPGWSVIPAELQFEMAPGSFLEADLAVAIPADAVPGCYPVRAQLTLDGADLPAAWRQTVEDVCLVSVGGGGGDVLRIINEPSDIEVVAGESDRLTVTIESGARGDLALEAHLISPWGTWEWIGPAATGAVLPAAGTAELAFDVTPPPWTEPGQWWALVRVACAGELLYSPAVRVRVLGGMR
ncbi:NEW3 domain-containing protein [Mycolicibacterium komossense]|uniref:Alpha-mannosidase n=1 Tax=Mycolicibacterium komossense TaxID=1779 RepID=A0ABT3CDE8_9MYCO|nr:NEW3 domain-containing protein [Mycolicibacterium komossense]MCV7227497.1 alpha-mannosidase [Mycolicibacterium komossense]